MLTFNIGKTVEIDRDSLITGGGLLIRGRGYQMLDPGPFEDSQHQKTQTPQTPQTRTMQCLSTLSGHGSFDSSRPDMPGICLGPTQAFESSSANIVE